MAWTDRSSRKRAALVATGCGVLLVSAVTVTGVASAAGETATINACVGKSTGIVRIISSSQKCLSFETAISWNQQGPTGVAGPAGTPGVAGPAGPPGSAGPAGPGGGSGGSGQAAQCSVGSVPRFSTDAPTLLGYLDYDGAPGDSRDSKFNQQVEVIGYDTEVTNAVAGGGGSGASVGKPVALPLQLRLGLDSSFPALLKKSATGKVDTQATLALTKPGEPGSRVYLRITLTDATVLKVNGHDPGEFNGIGVVDVCLGYSTITWTYIPQNSNGSAGTPVTTTLDVRNGTVT